MNAHASSDVTPGQGDEVDAIVDQWARERPDLETQAMAIMGRIYRIARVVGDTQEASYARFGLTRGEFDVLATLRRAGAPFRLSPSELHRTLMITSGGMTGRLDRLEQRGLVRREPDPDDRRALQIALTDPGFAAADEAVGVGLAAQRAVVETLPKADRDTLERLLRTVLAAATAARHRAE